MRLTLQVIFYCFSIAFLFAACRNKEKKEATLFEKIDPKQSGIAFTNTVENTPDFNIFSYRNFYNGGGVAIGDVNQDGLSDVYLTSNMGDNKLYLNRGNFRFEDVTDKAGVAGTKFWSTGVVLVDINADGLLDIYVCNAGYRKGETPNNELFVCQGIKEGIPVYQEKAAEYGLDEAGYTTHAAFFDYDLDGDLDCYILNNSFMPVNTLNNSNNRELYAEDWPVKDFLKGGGDKLLRNDGGHFTDVTRKSGIYGSLIGFGLGITVGDINGDHWPDLYVSNDFYERDYLYINQRDGTFKEEIEQYVGHLSLASMGADLADINNDGLPEIFTTEMLPGDETRLKTTTQFENYNIYSLKQQRGFYHQFMQNCLQLNNGNQTFSEIAHYAGVAASDWSWGALMFDMDNDGWRDIYVCNGIYKDVIDQDFIDFFADEVVQKMALTGEKEQINEVLNRMPSTPILNKAYRNTGQLKFDDVGEKWGFTTPSFSNGAAYGDLDNDGDLDLVVNNVNQPALLYQNHTEETLHPHYLSLQLKGKNTNTFAIGAQVFVCQGDQKQNFQLIPSRGFQSSVDYKMVFGLGQNPTVDSLLILWPDQTQTVLPHPQVDTMLSIQWPGEAPQARSGNPNSTPPLLTSFQSPISHFEPHHENDFIDFYPEPLAFRMTSREGPHAAAADINGDGREDVYIGGASGQAGQLWTQTAAGGFNRVERKTFDTDSLFEDTAVLFFDADGDGDQDLFVGSGGNEQPYNSPFLQSRLYMNDGKGHFQVNRRALPPGGFNTAVAVPLDFDADGDLDLFVGSRSAPGQYGVPPYSFLYENNGRGEFRDATRNAAPDFLQQGLVTDARLVNLAGDATPELVIVGEWRNPKIFSIKNRRLEPLSSNLDQLDGWWYALQAEDLDGDGDLDLILGNRGENFYFSGSKEQPAKLWVGDFDQNGSIEKILTRSVQGRDVPVLMKKDLTSQIPGLKKKNLKHVDYAKKSIQELFPGDILKGALVMQANYFSSVVALNEGNGQFTLKPLPAPVQFSCVCAIACADLDGDGRKDLLMGGNDDGFTPQFGRLDASFGDVLLNRGKGDFEWVPNAASGFFLKGDMRALVPLKIKGQACLLATVNNGAPKLWRLKGKTSQ